MSVSNLTSAALLQFTRALVCSLPPRSIPFVGWLAGTVWYLYDARRRRRVAENLRVAFGDSMCGKPGRRMARRIFRTIVRVRIEGLWSARLVVTPLPI